MKISEGAVARYFAEVAPDMSHGVSRDGWIHPTHSVGFLNPVHKFLTGARSALLISPKGGKQVNQSTTTTVDNSYLPGSGDTVINKAVFSWGSLQ